METSPDDNAVGGDISTDVLPAMKDVISLCEKNVGSQSKVLVQEIFDSMLSHKLHHARFCCVMNRIQAICGSLDGPDKDHGDKSMKHSVSLLMLSREKIRQYILQAIPLIDYLMENTTQLQAKLDVLQKSVDMPPISALKVCFANRLEAYSEKHKLLHIIKKDINCSSHLSPPGAEFGLKLFEDVKLHYDGRVLLRNKEDGQWIFPDELHPCRRMSGSPWGKILHDMTPGYFFDKEERDVVEWDHATPAKKYLDRLSTAHTMMRINRLFPIPISEYRKKILRNKRLAFATGLDYPVHDRVHFQRFVQNVDVSDMISEPFNKRIVSAIPKLDYLNSMVAQLKGGFKREDGVRVHEHMVYDIV